MNIFDAIIATGQDGPGMVVLGPSGETAFRLPVCPAGMTGDEPADTTAERRVRIGIRPHLIEIGVARGHDVMARVASNHWLGDQSHICLDVGGCSVVGVADRPIAARQGEMLPIRLPPAALHLFAAGSGLALAHGLATVRGARQGIQA